MDWPYYTSVTPPLLCIPGYPITISWERATGVPHYAQHEVTFESSQLDSTVKSFEEKPLGTLGKLFMLSGVPFIRI